MRIDTNQAQTQTRSGASLVTGKRRGLKFRLAMTAATAAVALPLVGGAGAVAMANHKLDSNIARAQLMGTQRMESPATDGKAVNILLVGTDARDRSQRGHSDLVVLAHVSSDRKRVDLIHYPSELRAKAPDHSSVQLKQAYAKGGTPMLVDTIQPLAGVPMDHVAVINFQGFLDMIDAIGGVTIDGQRMTGEEALKWVRTRPASVPADVHRGDRQMDLIQAVFAQAETKDVLLNPSKLNAYVDAFTKATTVDEGFSTAEMRELLVAMGGLDQSNIVQHTAPWAGANGLNAKQAPAQMAELRAALQNDSMASYVDTVSPVKGKGR